jgi:hypothetical protein
MNDIAPDLKAALFQANDIYQRGYEEGRLVGYREGFAEATRRASELVDKTLGPLVEAPKERK